MEKPKNYLKIRSEYSEYTGPRYCMQGPSSGEDFYHTILNGLFADTFRHDKMLIVDLDDTAGYLSSFLDEAFGNLIYDFSLSIVKPRLEILSKQEPDWTIMINNDVFRDWEQRRIDNNAPRKTAKHPEWYKLINNELILKIWI